MFGTNELEKISDIIQTADGGFLVTGHTDSYGISNASLWLARLDSEGYLLWNESFGVPGVGLGVEGTSLVETADGGFAVAGYYYYFKTYTDFWLIKIANNGTKEWDKVYHHQWAAEPYKIHLLPDGGFILTGGSEFLNRTSRLSTTYSCILRVDNFGNLLWNITSVMSLYHSQRTYDSVITPDGGIVLFVNSWKDDNFYLIKYGGDPLPTISPEYQLLTNLLGLGALIVPPLIVLVLLIRPLKKKTPSAIIDHRNS